ncbi:MAG: hypothetical protein J6M12_04925 [Clostridia bacterium]|nr:hypothetical protein [Clostridia bacterium]
MNILLTLGSDFGIFVDKWMKMGHKSRFKSAILILQMGEKTAGKEKDGRKKEKKEEMGEGGGP